MNQIYLQASYVQPSSPEMAVRAIVKLYNRAASAARMARLWSALGRRPAHLLSLEDIENTHTIQDRHHAGIQVVPIRRLVGSENRCLDFDAGFRPLQEHNKDRWLRVAGARQKGIPLPPVELVQVGEHYYVRDGHHRISVARAMGEDYIEAEVFVWKVQPIKNLLLGTACLSWRPPKVARKAGCGASRP